MDPITQPLTCCSPALTLWPPTSYKSSPFGGQRPFSCFQPTPSPDNKHSLFSKHTLRLSPCVTTIPVGMEVPVSLSPEAVLGPLCPRPPEQCVPRMHVSEHLGGGLEDRDLSFLPTQGLTGRNCSKENPFAGEASLRQLRKQLGPEPQPINRAEPRPMGPCPRLGGQAPPPSPSRASVLCQLRHPSCL